MARSAVSASRAFQKLRAQFHRVHPGLYTLELQREEFYLSFLVDVCSFGLESSLQLVFLSFAFEAHVDLSRSFFLILIPSSSRLQPSPSHPALSVARRWSVADAPRSCLRLL